MVAWKPFSGAIQTPPPVVVVVVVAVVVVVVTALVVAFSLFVNRTRLGRRRKGEEGGHRRSTRETCFF